MSDDVVDYLRICERFDQDMAQALADAMRNALVAAADHARAIESARAESRQAMGLPLSRDGDVSLYEIHDGDSVRYIVDGKEIARFPA